MISSIVDKIKESAKAVIEGRDVMMMDDLLIDILLGKHSSSYTTKTELIESIQKELKDLDASKNRFTIKGTRLNTGYLIAKVNNINIDNRESVKLCKIIKEMDGIVSTSCLDKEGESPLNVLLKLTPEEIYEILDTTSNMPAPESPIDCKRVKSFEELSAVLNEQDGDNSEVILRVDDTFILIYMPDGTEDEVAIKLVDKTKDTGECRVLDTNASYITTLFI